jgi:hypothetical protein
MKKMHLFLVMALLLPFLMGATAPRFAPDWFKKGEESRSVVVALEYPPFRSLSVKGNGPQVQILLAAFARAGLNVEVDMQPAKSLMIYALSQEGTPAVIGERADFKEVPSENLVFVPFYVKTAKYYYRAADRQPIVWNGNLENMRGRVLGLESAPETDAYEKAGIRVVVDNLSNLLQRLLKGEIDVVGADAERVKWALGAYFPEKRDALVPMKIPAWQSFSFAVFNTGHKNGQLLSGRFADVLRQMLKNGSYERLLKESGEIWGLTPSQQQHLEESLNAVQTKGE